MNCDGDATLLNRDNLTFMSADTAVVVWKVLLKIFMYYLFLILVPSPVSLLLGVLFVFTDSAFQLLFDLGFLWGKYCNKLS